VAAKRQRYNVLVRLDVVTDVDVYAETWEQALQKARALTLKDIKPDMTWIDGDGLSLESISKYENY
jgi:hypothetical protein